MNTKLFLRILYHDVSFYLLGALVFVGYLFIMQWHALFSTLLFFLLLFFAWIATTRRIFVFLKKPFPLWRSSFLLLGILAYTASLVAIVHILITAILDFGISLLLSSLLLAFFLMVISIPFFTGGMVVFHYLLFRLPKKHFSSHLQRCSTIFCSLTIFVLALGFLPEETELVLSGVLLMVYFAWQKAYLLS